MAVRRRIGSTRAAGAAFLRREIACCRSEIATIGSKTGRAVPLAAAVGWSAAAVMWGNAVVVAGRRYGHDQWITLVGVPVFGVASAWWLCRQRGFRLAAIGLRLPRVGGVRIVVAGLTLAAALVAAVAAAVGLVTFDEEMRGLRTIRTVVGTVFGEELIHRGVLLTLWAGTGVSAGRVLVANMVTFGAWHLAGATCHGFHPGEVLWPTAGAVLFVWLRLRFRSILAPMAVHALNVFGVLKPLDSFPAMARIAIPRR